MTKLDELKQKYGYAQNALSRKLGERDTLTQRKADLEEGIQDLSELIKTLDKVTVLLNSIGEHKQQEAQEKIEGIVTRGLQTIFGESFSFHINQTMRGKSASVEFTVKTYLGENVIETPVLESHGGGLAAIVGFLLRVTVLLLDNSTNNSKVLILDETFGMVSAEFLEPLGEFVRDLADKANLQIIMVTHQNEWESYADIVYRFGIRNGETYVKVES